MQLLQHLLHEGAPSISALPVIETQQSQSLTKQKQMRECT
jgi:hypothetical protein